ncbi:MAG: type IV toxin-antitoxin system AbiEi family antitoxin [Rothia sp. (in: high G+C Gram-positive bacteria)]|nr:type IV toxin-antitoxin system AbiEi family antitoxin [Rothia sp. (in: high G+C Gram-positive bacteria)]
MNSVQPSLLEALPYPLLSHQKPIHPKGFETRKPHLVREPESPRLNHELIQQSLNHLVDLSLMTSQAGEHQQFAKEHSLHRLIGNIYTPHSVTLTPLIRAQALLLHMPELAKLRCRISKQTAAWVWGYLAENTPSVHADFDKNHRINPLAAGRENLITHQVKTVPFDFIMLDQLAVTTPLRTALDLLCHAESTLEINRVVASMILDEKNSGCSLHKIHRILLNTKYLHGKHAALERLPAIEELLRNNSTYAKS